MVNIETREIDVTLIDPDPMQPRKILLGIEGLSEDIRQRGLLVPLLVRPGRPGRFLITHGERRFKAVMLLGWTTIRCEIKEMTESEVRDCQLSENMQRNQLSAIELSWEFERRRKLGQSNQEIADSIGRSVFFVCQRLALLRLSQKDQDRILHRQLTFTSARKLLMRKDPTQQAEVSENVRGRSTGELLTKAKSTAVNAVDGEKYVAVKELETYALLTSRESVSEPEFRAAVAQDLRSLRGEK